MNEFHPGSILHCVVLLVLSAVNVLLIQAGRAAQQRGKDSAAAMDRGFAIVLGVLWIVLTCLDLLPGHFRWDKSLPLHICDVAGLIAPIAIWTRRRQVRAILYLWGLGLSSQAFIWPMLYVGPAHLDFWTFVLCHSAIVSAAVYDRWVRGFRADWHDWQTTVVFSTVYALLVLPVNVRLGTNYGFMGRTSFAQPWIVLAMGRWPQRIPCCVALVWAEMAMLIPLGNMRIKRPSFSTGTARGHVLVPLSATTLRPSGGR